MSVANMTFLVNRLGDDCSPLQYIRELTQNAIEGIQLSGGSGEVVWDVSWAHYALDPGVYKLSCIDTGAGMTGEEMVKYINELSSSIHQQSSTGNFGVGAKIAAAPRNPAGLVYLSWKKGTGYMIHLWFDPVAGVYGLKRWPKNNGEFWAFVSDDLKPPQIKEHGTMVVLLGKSDDENTMEPPPGTPMRSRWILRYLNTRYFTFPDGVTVRTREGWELPRSNTKHNFLRVVSGQNPWLDDSSESRGVVELEGALAHWWILKADIDKDSGHNAGGGHVAALFQNELYELQIGTAGIAKLQGFGAIFGADRVVIYVEPSNTATTPVTANTARTQLLIDGEPINWSGWAAQFREQMPDELITLQEQIGSRSGEKDHKKAILERLRQIRDLLRFSRFRPSRDGAVTIDPEAGLGGASANQGTAKEGSREPGNKGGRAGDIYALFAEAGAAKGDPVESMSEPTTKWISVEDGTRPAGDLEDRAARFLLGQNTLLINGDFRVFTDMVERWAQNYQQVPGARAAVQEVVHEWFEQQLIEAVMSAQALRNTGKWSMQELEKLWSEEALTVAVLPRWHIDQSIKRVLGQRLGSLRLAA
jgi:hypothetical protein